MHGQNSVNLKILIWFPLYKMMTREKNIYEIPSDWKTLFYSSTWIKIHFCNLKTNQNPLFLFPRTIFCSNHAGTIKTELTTTIPLNNENTHLKWRLLSNVNLSTKPTFLGDRCTQIWLLRFYANFFTYNRGDQLRSRAIFKQFGTLYNNKLNGF